MSRFIHDLRAWGLGTAIWNARFDLGFRIGGFTSARR